MKYQELNGFTDWFDSAYETAKASVSEAADWVGDTVDSGYDWAADTVGEITDESLAKLKEFEDAMQKLLSTQKEVDQALESLPENSSLRVRLEKQRDESRGVFSRYIMPAWESFQDWASGKEAANTQLGVLPVIGLPAVIGAVSVALGYVYSNYKLEQKILNDPELKAQYAASKVGQMASLATMGKYAALAAVVLVGGNLVMGFKK